MAVLKIAYVQIFWKLKGKTIKCSKLAIFWILELQYIYFTPSLEVLLHRDGTDGIHLLSNYFYAKIKLTSKEIKERNSAEINSLEKNGQGKQLFSIQRCLSFLKMPLISNALAIKISSRSSVLREVCKLFLSQILSQSLFLMKPKSKHL